MNDTTISRSRIQPNGYCSESDSNSCLRGLAYNTVSKIKEILSMRILCRHSIVELNRLWEEQDLLEKKAVSIPTPNSADVLKFLIEKITQVSQKTKITPEDVINLYHLQGFCELKQQVAQIFSTIKHLFFRNSYNHELLSKMLPCCLSENSYNEDITALFQGHLTAKVDQILQSREEKLRKFVYVQSELARRKAELRQRRERGEKIPRDFDILLERGYLNLYDHLLEMKALPNRNARKSKIESLSFSEAANIILEAREAITGQIFIEVPPSTRNVITLVGGSGSGKSTVLCFLRGDRMLVSERTKYVSADDSEDLIGHEEATSRTLLPSVALIDKIVLIDFPGFNDTHGPLISLSIELALKALFNRYATTLLVLEAITNDQGRYAAAAQLGLKLGRIVENKNQCLLGITKYLENKDFSMIQEIEDQQREQEKAKIARPSSQESELQVEIELSIVFNEPGLTEKQERLRALERERKARQIPQHLSDTPEKTIHRLSLNEAEKILQQEIGLAPIIPFDILSNSKRRACLQQLLLSQQPALIKTDRKLSPDDVNLLDGLFAKMNTALPNDETLQHIPDEHEESDRRDSIAEKIEKSVLERGLIQTLFSKSKPEIHQLLTLADIDPTLLRKYEKALLENAIRHLKMCAIANLNVDLFQSICDGAQSLGCKPADITNLKFYYDRLTRYIAQTLGTPIPSDPDAAINEWRALAERHRNEVNDIDEKISIPIAFHLLSLGGTYAITYYLKRFLKNRISETVFRNYSEFLNQTYDDLLRFHGLQITLEKREQIDHLFNSTTIDPNHLKRSGGPATDLIFLEGVYKKLANLKQIYGPDQWERRVIAIRNEIDLFRYFDPYERSGKVFSCIVAYFLMEPGVILSHGLVEHFRFSALKGLFGSEGYAGGKPYPVRLIVSKKLQDHVNVRTRGNESKELEYTENGIISGIFEGFIEMEMLRHGLNALPFVTSAQDMNNPRQEVYKVRSISNLQRALFTAAVLEFF